MNMNEYEKAIADCKRSISFDANYSKAYGRLGYFASRLLYAVFSKDYLGLPALPRAVIRTQ